MPFLKEFWLSNIGIIKRKFTKVTYVSKLYVYIFFPFIEHSYSDYTIAL